MFRQSVISEGMSPKLIPNLQDTHTPFAQMDNLQQTLIKSWSRDTLICERVLGILTPTPPGVEFWKTKIRFYPAGHKKKSAATKRTICRTSLYGVRMKFLKNKDSTWTVGHIWSSGNSITTTIIIYQETIIFNHLGGGTIRIYTRNVDTLQPWILLPFRGRKAI